MNKVILSGNLVKNIELNYTESKKAVCKGTIAVKRDRKNPNGEYDSDFIDFVCWEHNAEYMKNFSNKGCRLELVGRWQVRDAELNNGEKRRYHEVIVESITCFKLNNEKQDSDSFTYDDAMKRKDTQNKNEFDDKDLPF